MERTYKFTPVSMYDIQGLEKWLEKLAAQGLFLKKYRPLVCTFTRGESRRVRYRLEPCRYGIDGPPDDMLDLYQEYGWAHVGGVNHEMVIFSCDNPHAPEPHTDLDIQLEQWNKLARKARKEFRQMVILILVVLLGAAAILFWGGTPLAKLLTFRNQLLWWSLYMILFPLKELAVNYTRARELAAVIRELECRPKQRRLWFPSRQFFSWMGAVLFISLAGLFVFILRHPDLGEAKPVTEFTPLTLTELETGQPEHREVFYGTPLWSPICWRQWRVLELDGRRWNSEPYRFLETRWFDLPLSSLAVPAARDLLASSMKLEEDIFWNAAEPVVWSTREYPDAGADWLSVADSEDGGYHTAVAALEDKVVLVRYIGSGSLTDYLDKIVDMLK